MPIQVSAHGFEITASLKEACDKEVKERLSPLSLNSLKAKWILSIERQEHISHLIWDDGIFHGDITVKTNDMMSSIHQCAKKAAEQIKKSHDKKQNRHKEEVREREELNDD